MENSKNVSNSLRDTLREAVKRELHDNVDMNTRIEVDESVGQISDLEETIEDAVRREIERSKNDSEPSEDK